MQAYDHLAEWFEYLNDDCDYALWSQYFIEGLRRLGAGARGLEMGCGSGRFCRDLARAGFSMTGADLSAPMLSKAVSLAAAEGLSIPFLQADAATVRVPARFDFLIAPNDCYNYVAGEALPKAFRRAADCIVSGGIFWFDLSSAYKLRGKVANNMFADDRDDVCYLSFNRLLADRVETDVTLFAREGELFRRYDEHHTQYIHEEERVLSALRGAGFSVLSVEGHLGAPAEGSDRLNFICKKVSSTRR